MFLQATLFELLLNDQKFFGVDYLFLGVVEILLLAHGVLEVEPVAQTVLLLNREVDLLKSQTIKLVIHDIRRPQASILRLAVWFKAFWRWQIIRIGLRLHKKTVLQLAKNGMCYDTFMHRNEIIWFCYKNDSIVF